MSSKCSLDDLFPGASYQLLNRNLPEHIIKYMIRPERDDLGRILPISEFSGATSNEKTNDEQT